MALNRRTEQVIDFVALTIMMRFIGVLLFVGVVCPAVMIYSALSSPDYGYDGSKEVKQTWEAWAQEPANPIVPEVIQTPPSLDEEFARASHDPVEYRRVLLKHGFEDPGSPEARRKAEQWTTQ